MTIDGQEWNLDQTVSYLIRIYRKESIVPNSWGRQSQARRRGNDNRDRNRLPGGARGPPGRQVPAARRRIAGGQYREAPVKQQSMRRRFWER